MKLENLTTESLTGLPYADVFKAETERLLKCGMKNPVMVSVDISNFKYFNQMYGYDEGDVLIKKYAKVYCHDNKECVLAFRIYVDHIILLLDVEDEDMSSIEIRYDELNRRFSASVNEEYPLARVRAYMGIYIIEDVNENITKMIDRAQYARRSIKINYTQTVAMFTQGMAEHTEEEAGIIPMFFSALENDRVKVYIQPKFSIEEQKLIGGEALSRIMDKDGNIVPPKAYIDILESTGLISKLDYYVILKVIEIQKNWMEKGYELTTISMNLSRKDFWEPQFIKAIDECIVKSGVPTKYFEFELTETLFCENYVTVISQLDYLRKRGYKISMDDFGSGYNSLYMLGKVPVDIIKFDRGFVLNSLGVESGRKILKNLMNTFTDIEFDVICEGIENREEEKIVHDCGCNAGQGYLYDMPLPYDKFEDKYMTETMGAQ